MEFKEAIGSLFSIALGCFIGYQIVLFIIKKHFEAEDKRYDDFEIEKMKLIHKIETEGFHKNNKRWRDYHNAEWEAIKSHIKNGDNV